MGKEETVENLKTLYLVTERFSHSLRTPISVALGVVDDHLAGHKLSTQDYTDAQIALNTVRTILDTMRPFAVKPEFLPKECALVELIDTLREQSKCYESLSFQFESNCSEAKIACDKSMLVRTFGLLFAYLEARARKGGVASPVLVLFAGKPHSIEILFGTDLLAKLSLSERRTALIKLSEIDHTTESLGLLFAHNVFALHGLRSWLEVSPDRAVIKICSE